MVRISLYTTSDTISGPNGSTAVLASTASADYATGSLKAPDTDNAPHYHVVGSDFTDTSTLPSSTTVKKGSTKKVRVKFDVTDAVTFDDGAAAPDVICYPSAPTVSFEIIAPMEI